MEDLTGINLSAKVRHKDRYYRISWSFAQLQSFIEYKAQQKGLQVIHVDPKYTSQRCPRCGHTEKANRDKKNHIFSCKACRYTLNDDLIGAKNIWQKGLEYRMLVEEQIAAVSMTYTEGLPSASPM